MTEMIIPTDGIVRGNVFMPSSQDDVKDASIWSQHIVTVSWLLPLQLKELVIEPFLKPGLKPAWFAPWSQVSGWSLIMPPSTKEGALNSWLSKQGVKCCTCLLILQTSIRLRTAGHGSKVAFVTARASLIVCETQWNMSWNFRLNSYGDCYSSLAEII